MTDLREKLAADTPGESPAELRERARMARQEARDAAEAARIAYRAWRAIHDLGPVVDEGGWWEEIEGYVDTATDCADKHKDRCLERANELDEQAEEASLSPSSRRLMRAEGQ